MGGSNAIGKTHSFAKLRAGREIQRMDSSGVSGVFQTVGCGANERVNEVSATSY